MYCLFLVCIFMLSLAFHLFYFMKFYFMNLGLYLYILRSRIQWDPYPNKFTSRTFASNDTFGPLPVFVSNEEFFLLTKGSCHFKWPKFLSNMCEWNKTMINGILLKTNANSLHKERKYVKEGVLFSFCTYYNFPHIWLIQIKWVFFGSNYSLGARAYCVRKNSFSILLNERRRSMIRCEQTALAFLLQSFIHSIIEDYCCPFIILVHKEAVVQLDAAACMFYTAKSHASVIWW